MGSTGSKLPQVIVLVASGCGLLLSGGAAAVLLLGGIFYLLADPHNTEMAYIAIAFGWESALVGLLMLPAAVSSLGRLLEKSFRLPSFPRWFGASPALMLWPVLVGAGYLAARLTGMNWLFLPTLQILAIGIPIWWLVSLSGRDLVTSPDSTHWKIFSVTLLFTNPLIFFLELIVFIGAVVIWITGRPDIMDYLRTSFSHLNPAAIDPAAAEQLVADFLAFPGVVSVLFIATSVMAPLFEEPLKTIGVWLLFKKGFTPAMGFTTGAVCGAAFALAESLGNLNRPFDELTWTMVLVGRVGTGIMHIFASGLTGWGIASLASRGKIIHTLLGYLAAFILHGLWNFNAVAAAIHPFLNFGGRSNRFLYIAGTAGLYSVGCLAILYLGGIFWMNRRLLRRQDGLQPAFDVQ